MIIKSDIFIKLISWFNKPMAITLYPFIIYSPKRMEGYFVDVLINHEKIHIEQQKELYVIGFYILYIYYFIKLRSYYDIPFEQEAYKNQTNVFYLQVRKKHSWRKYI